MALLTLVKTQKVDVDPIILLQSQLLEWDRRLRRA